MPDASTLRLSGASFDDSREHLLAELSWLELVLQREVARTRMQRDPEERFDEFSGLFISEKEIERYLSQGDPGRSGELDGERLEPLNRRIAEARSRLDARIQSTLDRGVRLRIVDLVRAFQLTAADVFILLSAVAPDIDIRFQRYFGFLQNDVAKKRPTLQLLSRVWGEGRPDRVSVRELFAPETRLLSESLLSLPANTEAQPFPAQQPIAAESVVDYLCGVDRLDPRLRGFAEVVDGSIDGLDRPWESRQRDIISQLTHALSEAEPGQVFYIWGPEGNGIDRTVAAIAGGLRRRVLRVRCGGWLGAPETAVRRLESLRCDARLFGCLLHFCCVDDLVEHEQPLRATATAFRDFALSNTSLGIILTGARRLEDVRSALGIPLRGFEIPCPPPVEREQIWRDKLDGAGRAVEADLVSRLAVSFRFTAGQIESVIRNATRARGPFGAGEIFRCCREESSHSLLNFAARIAPKYKWSDLVVPPDTRAQLQEIANCVRSRATVFGAWGFEEKFSLGKGLNVLFAGPSGTGKTMSAEIIAGDLQLDLFKLDLSCIVSKYVGETERNLSKIFHEAAGSNAILFFDEADALFGKRSEVKDAHDRYANIEINYLLQKMDDYEGIVIMATNLRSNLDSAFTRRLNYIVEFPFPEESYRKTMWRQVFPTATPLSADIDFDFLANRFKLTGGNIKNIALNSAFLAARNGGRVTMEQLIQATRREFQKMGKLCSRAEFGCYYRLLNEEAAL